MQFQRTKLIDLVKAEIQRRTEQAVLDSDRSAEEYQQSIVNYRERYDGDWAQFASNIKTALNAGRAVTRDDVPETLWVQRGYELVFQKKSAPKSTAANVADLITLKALLESVEDEKISTAELQRLGFKVPAIFS